MATRIAHVSDIHIERGDTNVSDRLTEALRRERPDILVASGDFADQFWRVGRGQKWLMDLCAACHIDKSHLIVVPGNHDYGFLGIAGFKPLTGRWFRREFSGWNKPRVVFVKDPPITFFKIDSNPWILNFARGRIRSRQLNKLRRELDAKTPAERAAIEASTKIVVVHHHPFPVPYEGKDTFLMLKNAQAFIQFLAERKIDIVLHGHKHRAPHSLLELGTCIGRNRVIEVIGAGTAIAENDQDKRGNNFNLITIEDNGLRYVRQFFAQPGEKFREVRGDSFLMNAFEFSYRRALACSYKYAKVHWDLLIAEDGDGFNEISYAEVSPVDGAKLEPIKLPAYEVDTGYLSPLMLDKRPGRTSEGVDLKTVPEGEGSRKLRPIITFTNSPTEDSPANFVLRSYDRNSFAMNSSEFKKKHPGRDDGLEWAEKEILEPMEEFSWAVRFPADFRLDHKPRFEVFPVAEQELTPTQKQHEWLTKVLQPCFHYSDALNTAFLSIHKPPTSYRYRISWRVPTGKPAGGAADLPGQFRVQRFAASLLRIREFIVSAPKPDSPEAAEWVSTLKPLQDTVNTTLATFVASVATWIEKTQGLENILGPEKLDADELDITLMVYDDSEKDQSPKLRIVAGDCRRNPDYWNFCLEVGDGNAGRAYKKKIILPFDKEKAEEDLANQTYVPIPGIPPHEVLYSIPLVDPRSPGLIFAVLNFGTFSQHDAKLLRTLDNRASLELMSNQAQSYVLTKLLEALRMN